MSSTQQMTRLMSSMKSGMNESIQLRIAENFYLKIFCFFFQEFIVYLVGGFDWRRI